MDADCLVADKPAGLLSVPGRGADRLDCLKSRLEAMHGTLQIVHRLDMDTSGLMVFARTKEAASALSSAFENRRVHKRYSALVEGVPDSRSGEIALPIGRDWEARPRRKIDMADGRPALTRWRLAGQTGSGALMDLEPVTGRTHQLRLHLSAIGHPVLGDRLYGRAETASRLCLHACQLGFPHPQSGDWILMESRAAFGKMGIMHK